MLALIFVLSRPRKRHAIAPGATAGTHRSLGVGPNALMMLLCTAHVGCCVAMAMPDARPTPWDPATIVLVVLFY
jgi:hypothetical protein